VKKFFTVVALIIMFAMSQISITGISREGMAILGTGMGCLILWNFVDLRWPCLLCIASMALFSGLPVSSVFASAMGNWIIVFLMSSFMIGHALNKEGLTKRIAIMFVTNRAVKKNPWFLVLFFLSGALFMSFLMSPTATFLVFLPIAERVFDEVGYKEGEYVPTVIIIALVVTTNIGSAMSPLGHAIPMLAISFGKILADVDISFGTYIKFGILNGIVLFTIFLGILKFVFLRRLRDFSNFNPEVLKIEITLVSKREKAVLLIFVTVVLMWLAPWAFSLISYSFAQRLISAGGAVPPMIGVVALSIIHVNGDPLLDIKQAMKETVPWDTLLLLAATLALGSTLTKPELGIIETIVKLGESRLKTVSPFTFLVITVFWAVLQSNFTVNSLSVTIVSSVAIPLAMSYGIISPAILSIMIGTAASMAFATAPISAPCTVAAGTAWWQPYVALKLGGAMALASIPVMIFWGYPVARFITCF
jgi:sodium-dependent dicarboxylate transporter 2/3/5